MKPSFFSAAVLLTSSWMFPNHTNAQVDMTVAEAEIFQMEHVTSSLFEMVLYPTPLKLDAHATSRVANIIKNLLLVSSSSSNVVFSVDSFEILVEEVQFEQQYDRDEKLLSSSVNLGHVEASLIEFKVIVGLHTQDKTSTSPSQFNVDNLVVRAFSQPSTKSNFLDLITLTNDPLLVEVEDIGINLVKDSSNEEAADKGNASLSSIDIILIIISSCIFVGTLYFVIAYYHKDGYEDFWEQSSITKGEIHDDHRLGETDSIDSIDDKKRHTPLEEKLRKDSNIIDDESLESSIDSQSQMVLSLANESPVISFASSSASDSTSSSSSSACVDSTKERFNTPIEPCIEIAKTSQDSESIGSKGYHESKLSATTTDNLATKLRNLPGSNEHVRRLKASAMNSSTASAPTILHGITNRKWENMSTANENSIKSTYSTASTECLQRNKKREKTIVSLPTSLKSHLLLNNFVMVGTTEEFHKSWLESQRKALEDVEEGSVDDVFRIDVQRNGDAIDNNEIINSTWSTPVFEWMKLIRVVHSASETHSSLGPSSIEPKLFHARESYSLDLSLEDSLAKSSVDPEVN